MQTHIVADGCSAEESGTTNAGLGYIIESNSNQYRLELALQSTGITTSDTDMYMHCQVYICDPDTEACPTHDCTNL